MPDRERNARLRKTTVTRLIAGMLPRAALLRSEYLAEMVVSGMVWALGEPRRQQLLTNRNMCMLANNFAAEDITPVLDYGLFSRELLDLSLGKLTPRPLMLVMLAPGLKVCQDRNAARDDDERLDFDYSPLEEDWNAKSAASAGGSTPQLLPQTRQRSKSSTRRPSVP